MPSSNTITSTDILTASAGLTISSAAWNTHAGIWRGHLLPVDASASAAADNTYDLGSSSYRWRNLYTAGDLSVATVSQTISSTTGAFSFGSQHMVLCNANGGAFSVTLPAAANVTGRTIALKKTDSTFNLITVDGNGSETIDSTTTTYLSTENECLYLISDGTNWQKKHRYIDGKVSTWTPTGTWSTNVAFSGKMWREGKFGNFEVNINVTGGVTTAGLAINMPTGLNIDTTYLYQTTSGQVCVGLGSYIDVGSASYQGVVVYGSTSTVNPVALLANATYAYSAGLSGSVPHTWANTDFLRVTYKVPIIGWES